MPGVVENYQDLTEKTAGSNGEAYIVPFELTEDQARRARIREIMNRSPYPLPEVGKYIKLYVNGELMMSDTPMEKSTNINFVNNAHGKVMIAGLGIGLIINALRPKIASGEVTSITVYEKYQDVIDLVYPRYKDLPLTVIKQDILEYMPPKDEKYDTIYFDIWPNISVDNLPQIKMLHNRWKFHKLPGGWMDSWVKKDLQRSNRQSRGWW